MDLLLSFNMISVLPITNPVTLERGLDNEATVVLSTSSVYCSQGIVTTINNQQ